MFVRLTKVQLKIFGRFQSIYSARTFVEFVGSCLHVASMDSIQSILWGVYIKVHCLINIDKNYAE